MITKPHCRCVVANEMQQAELHGSTAAAPWVLKTWSQAEDLVLYIQSLGEKPYPASVSVLFSSSNASNARRLVPVTESPRVNEEKSKLP